MLNQLSGLLSPPLPTTPLTVVSSGHRDQDLAALRTVAPSAVVRGGSHSSLRALANRNTVVVLDRCGRMVYQQTLQQSDTNLQSVEVAILSAHLDEPCGPCHLPLQEEPSHGRVDQIHDKTTSQAKMSRIANAYALSNAANNPTEARHHKAAVEESIDDRRVEPEEETVSETTPKPERKKNKKKNKPKKGKHEKQKKRKRVEEAVTSTSKPMETGSNEGCERDCDTPDCECDVRAKDFGDEIEKLISASETANEILGMEESGPGPFLPSSMIIWANDKRKKQKNGKRARVELEREIDEGIEMVREEEELVEYPDAIGGDDNILAAIEKAVGEVRQESHRGSENGLSREDGDVDGDRQEEGLQTDDRVPLPDETVYWREREEEKSRGELMGYENVWGTSYRQDESEDAGEKKKQKKSKDVPKKGKKTEKEEGKYKRVEKIREEDRSGGFDWDALEETDSQESVLPWPVEEIDVDTVAEREVDGDTVAEREMDSGRFAERETDGGRFAEREMDGGGFVERETDGGSFSESEMDSGRFAERETDRARFSERETDGGRFAERETELTPQYAAWRDATVVPTEHDSRSSGGDSSDQTGRLVVYESEGDYSTSDKVEQLHSKVKPWSKGKHY